MRTYLVKLLAICLLISAKSTAQYISNQSASVQDGNFNISGTGKASTFRAVQETGGGGNIHYIIEQSPGIRRWGLGTHTQENATETYGSDFSIFAYRNNGDYQGQYLTIKRSNGNVGLNTLDPSGRLHIANTISDARAALKIGAPGDAGNLSAPVGSATGRYNIDFYTWRDVVPDQVGARISAVRENNWGPGALVQTMDISFLTSNGLDESNLTEKLRIRHNGNVGIGTATPQSYYHSGNNRALEIFNPVTSANSQSHLILSTGATSNIGSVGSISWMAPNAANNKGVAYIGATIVRDATTDAAGDIMFATANGSTPVEHMRLTSTGSLGIGTSTPGDNKLAVEGTIGARRVKVSQNGWADFVFEPDYKLPSLTTLETYIKENKHLPDVPLAADVKKNGLDLGEMNKILLQKVEELTLYIIELEKRVAALEPDKKK
jgi:hypothetical protein